MMTMTRPAVKRRFAFPIRRLPFTLAILTILVLSPRPGWAVDVGDEYLRVGYGTYHCDHYAASYGYQPVDEAGFTNWVAGYLTAINKALPETYDIKQSLDLHGVMDWLLAYCDQRDHQNDTVADAAAAFVKAQYSNRRTRR